MNAPAALFSLAALLAPPASDDIASSASPMTVSSAAQPGPVEWGIDTPQLRRERVLHVVRVTMTTGGGGTRYFENGWRTEDRTPAGIAHMRLRVGAVTGESLGPTFTIEGGGAWQRPGAFECVDEPCLDPAPEAGSRLFALAGARVGYEGRNGAFDIGAAFFRCPGCWDDDHDEAAEALWLPSFSGRIGPPVFHAWGEYGTGAYPAIGDPARGARMIPAAFGIGHRSRYVDVRAGVTQQGWVASADTPLFEGLRVGVTAWGSHDQYAGAIRITVPLGRGQPKGQAYRPGVYR